MCCSMLSKLASMYVKALDVDRAIFKQYRKVFRSVDFSLLICEGGSCSKKGAPNVIIGLTSVLYRVSRIFGSQCPFLKLKYLILLIGRLIVL